jgi:1-acyl-sn-glycerol-3-phosphate acyltransferase
VSVRSLAAAVRARAGGAYTVDPWGYDPDLVELVDPVSGLIWPVRVSGAERLPGSGPAVLVANRRLGLVEPFVVARGLRLATGRRVRFLGIPDVALLGPALRRAGGAIARPEELAALLRAGQVCLLPLSRCRSRWVAGTLPPETLAPALALGAPVVPVAVTPPGLTGPWRVWVGEPVPAPVGRGPLALAEMAEAVREGVQALLDEAHPPRWPFR